MLSHWKKLKLRGDLPFPPLPHCTSIMPNIAPTIARQALRIASRRYPSSAFSRAAGVAGRRQYVSESKSSQATVNVDTAIKQEQRAFLDKTGQRPSDATMPTTGMGADAMMSPSAGKLQPFAPQPRLSGN
jgi:cysteine desulfurase